METKYELSCSIEPIQYDMYPYIQIWMNHCSDEKSSIQFIEKMKCEKGWFTGDFIKCCLKLVNLSKEIESICSLDCLEKIKEGKSKLLKFICTNKSLYLV